jgi:hypothetical protein
MLTQSPAYDHDCAECQFQGSVVTDSGIADCWIHPGEHGSVIFRYSSDGSDYASRPLSMFAAPYSEETEIAFGPRAGTVVVSGQYILQHYFVSRYLRA